MKIRYDLHIHSALSPCAEDDSTPVSVVGAAKILGLDMIAVADHNAIANVEVAIQAGECFGVTVIPAFELQTSEEIHVLCLFQRVSDLKAFFNEISFLKIKNDPNIFGRQLIYDEDDNIIGEEEDLLLINSAISCENVPTLIEKYNGVAIPAHIDREANGMLNILGAVTENYKAVEFSARADAEIISEYSKRYKIIIDSDAHTLCDINAESEIELKENTAKALIEWLKSGVNA